MKSINPTRLGLKIQGNYNGSNRLNRDRFFK